MIEVRKTVYSNDELFTDMKVFSGKERKEKSKKLFSDWVKKVKMLDKSKVRLAKVEMNRISRGKITFLKSYDLQSDTEKNKQKLSNNA